MKRAIYTCRCFSKTAAFLSLCFIAIASGTRYSWAQSSPPTKQFEVVSIRPFGARHGLGGIVVEDNARVSYSPVAPFTLLLRAYRLNWYEVEAPQWMKTGRYQFDATLPKGATTADIPEMLQHVLADRFHLIVHREVREMPVYTLRVSDRGLRLAPCAGEKCPANQSMIRPGVSVRVEVNSIQELVFRLNAASDRRILDQTNIREQYSIVIEGVPPGSIPSPSNPLPSIFGALKQIGLVLAPQRERVDILVVDGGSPVPTEN